MLCYTCKKERNDWDMCFDNKKSCPAQPCKECKKKLNKKSEKAKLTGKFNLQEGKGHNLLRFGPSPNYLDGN